MTPSPIDPKASRAARATEESFVSLAAWVVLAILGVCTLIADISVIGGIALLMPLPISISRRIVAAKKTVRLRKEHLKAYTEAKGGNANSEDK